MKKTGGLDEGEGTFDICKMWMYICCEKDTTDRRGLPDMILRENSCWDDKDHTVGRASVRRGVYSAILERHSHSAIEASTGCGRLTDD